MAHLLPLLAAAAAAAAVRSKDLVGPGAIAAYTGGSARKKVGTVSEPAAGFFIAGSSIADMNGVYQRVRDFGPRGTRDHDHCHLCYRKWPINEQDDGSGWQLALVPAPPPSDGGFRRGPVDEWLLIDPPGFDRFGHAGDTIIPGAGKKWSHLRGPDPKKGTPRTFALARPGLDTEAGDYRELPWQLIFISSMDRVRQYRWEELDHRRTVRMALAGSSLPRTPASLQSLPAGEKEPHTEEELGLKALEEFAAGRFEVAAALYEAELQKATALAGWTEVKLGIRAAECHRRARAFTKAETALVNALAIYPAYKRGLVEKGKLLLDQGRPSMAIRVFEQLLRLHREEERATDHDEGGHMQGHRRSGAAGVLPWLLRAHAQMRRATAVAKVVAKARSKLPSADGVTGDWDWSAAPDHYALLQLAVDHSPTELRNAYKRFSKLAHPDRNGGSAAAFAAVVAAHETLMDSNSRASYDVGDDLDRGVEADGSEGEILSVVIERLYFPERFGFDLYGDSLKKRRKYEEKLAAQKAETAASPESGKPPPPPPKRLSKKAERRRQKRLLELQEELAAEKAAEQEEEEEVEESDEEKRQRLELLQRALQSL